MSSISSSISRSESVSYSIWGSSCFLITIRALSAPMAVRTALLNIPALGLVGSESIRVKIDFSLGDTWTFLCSMTRRFDWLFDFFVSSLDSFSCCFGKSYVFFKLNDKKNTRYDNHVIKMWPALHGEWEMAGLFEFWT